MQLPVLASIVLDETWLIKYFMGVGISSMIIGLLMVKKFKKKALDLRLAFMIASLAWLLIPLISSIPVYYGTGASPLGAFFECMAGYTTTGITVLTPSEIPRTILFWRSLMEWIGAVGVVLVFLAILAPTNVASKLYAAEGHSERLEPSISRTINTIFYIYVYMTLIGILALYLAGFSVFEAINHGMTAIATAGFSTNDDSYASVSPLLKIITMVLMIAGAVSFAVHQRLISKDFKAFYMNLEVRALLALIVIFSFLLYLDGVPLVDSFFNVISGVTTTGFSSMDLSQLSELSKYYLVALMNIGGGFGSTAGGLKIIRFLIIIKAVEWYIRKITAPPRSIIPFKIQNKVFSENEVFTTLLFVVLYFFFLIAGSFLMVFIGHSLIDSLFMVSTAQGNNGLVVLIPQSPMEQIILAFHMWIGRLEIIPVLVLLKSFKK